jgi:hypothetical protein
VERWRSGCGCRMDGQTSPSQEWRSPLRKALAELGERLHETFEREGQEYFDDPWAVRDAWSEVVALRAPGARSAVVRQHARAPITDSELARSIALLEMERDALRMFTSCAWFFDDIGGLEPKQVLRYARRAMRLSGNGAGREPSFMARLGHARSNDPKVGSGADVYRSVGHHLSPGVRIAAAARALSDLGVAGRDGVTDGEPGGDDIWEATVRGEVVWVRDRLLSTEAQYRTILRRRTSSDLTYEITSVDGEGWSGGIAHLSDFPERLRRRVRRALRDALLSQCLTVDELGQLASGSATLRDLAGGALTRAIRALEPGALADDAVTHLGAALDLFEQIEVHIPFDSQTAFWDLWQALSDGEREGLRGIARRLGFIGD